MSMCQALIADFGKEIENTRKILDAVPEDKFDWKPHEKSMPLGALAGHVAENPDWTSSMMVPVFDFVADAADYKPFVPSTKAELMEAFEKNYGGFAETLGDGDDDFFRETWTMRAGDTVMMEEERHWAIRQLAIHHMIHHRGQLTVYLRMLDVPVPGTYGPTADEKDG